MERSFRAAYVCHIRSGCHEVTRRLAADATSQQFSFGAEGLVGSLDTELVYRLSGPRDAQWALSNARRDQHGTTDF